MPHLRKEDYTYLCVIQGLSIEESDVPDFEAFLLDKCGTRVQFLETYRTLPDLCDGIPVADTGGRADVIFSVHKNDIAKLHLGHRMELGIRWLDDAISNAPDIYEERIKNLF
jgi:hypothetical protein